MTERKLAPGFRADEWRDVGHGVRIRFLWHHNMLDALEYEHTCGERGVQWDSVMLAPKWTHGWQIVCREPLELSPSLLCRLCGTHGFVRGGKWVPA